MAEGDVLLEHAAGAEPAEGWGGKATNLARLVAAGADVPPFIVVPADVELDEAGRRQVRDALERAGLGGELLAVRSSAAAEDAADASFAGQFETVLGVPADGPELWEAIGTVRESAGSARVLAYAQTRGEAVRTDAAGGVSMAVILQALVDAEASGVVFSADPVTGDRGTAVVSAVHGLGEALVSGEVDADTYRVRWSEGVHRVDERVVATQTRALRAARGGPRWVDLPESERTSPALDDAEVLEVADAARRLARALGAPQDIEWAYVATSDGAEGRPRRLLLLQARPITTLPVGERRIWDNSNIIESYAGVTTPLTFSFARAVYEDVYRQFCSVMGVEGELIERNRSVFAGMLGLMRGRVYYNLLNWYRLLSLLPGYAFNRSFMERMMGVREKLEDPPEPQLVAGKGQDLVRLLKMVVRMVGENRRLRRTVPAFHARVDAALVPLLDEDLSRWEADDLMALYRRLEDDLLRHWQPPLVNDFFAMIWFGVLGRLLAAWLPEEPLGTVNDLLAGEGGIVSTEPARLMMRAARRVADDAALSRLFADEPEDAALWTSLAAAEAGPAAELYAELRAYLRRFSDRCANELKLETITPAERPEFLIGVLRSYLRQGSLDPDASRERETRIRREAEARVRTSLRGWQRPLFFAVLGATRTRIRDRENLRFERTRVYGAVRRIFVGFGHALASAGRIDEPRDVFWLRIEEVFAWVDGTAAASDYRSTIALRKAEFESYRETPAPPERLETFGPPAEGLARIMAGMRAPGEADSTGPGAAVLHGTGCCPGVVRAPVRLVRDPTEAGDLSGRILVAERTDPGWTLLFPAAAGLLVERGSLLSHSAIVAREVGLPCVVSVPRLMDTLHEGELVEMDGATGTIRRLSVTT